jgi:hypothetical protein
MSESRFHAFLSHNGADKAAVEEVARRLTAEGVRCWLDRWQLIPGRPWQPALEEELGRCDCCVVFVGPSGISPWQHEEMRLAINRRVRQASPAGFRVIPVFLPGAAPVQTAAALPDLLTATTWVEFHASLDEAENLHRLRCGILDLPPGPWPQGGPPFRQTDQCFYPGLRAFETQEGEHFFGRESRVERLLGRLGRAVQAGEGRFLALVGPSGCGKSSLARAGVLHALGRGRLGGAEWPVVTCRPGQDPLEELARALWAAPLLRDAAGDVGDLIDRLAAEQRRLHLVLASALHAAPEARKAVVLIDQFEEAFTLCRSDERRRAFIDNLLHAAAVPGGRAVVLLTLRADYYGQCAAHPGLAAALSERQELVPPLTDEELRRAIELPARLAGLEVETGLTELLVQDARTQPGALPLLQHALRQLWEGRSDRRLTAEAYRSMGGLERALERKAEATYESLTGPEQAACRAALLRLVQVGEDGTPSRRRVSAAELGASEATRAVVARLAAARLLTAGGGEPAGGGACVEIAHEALIRGWPRLRDWVESDREAVRSHQRLRDACAEWEQSGRDPSFLFTGGRLAAALALADANPDLLNEQEKRFLAAPREALRKEMRRGAIRLAAFVAFVFACGTLLFAFQQSRVAEVRRRLPENPARWHFVAFPGTPGPGVSPAEVKELEGSLPDGCSVVPVVRRYVTLQSMEGPARVRALAAFTSDADWVLPPGGSSDFDADGVILSPNAAHFLSTDTGAFGKQEPARVRLHLADPEGKGVELKVVAVGRELTGEDALVHPDLLKKLDGKGAARADEQVRYDCIHVRVPSMTNIHQVSAQLSRRGYVTYDGPEPGQPLDGRLRQLDVANWLVFLTLAVCAGCLPLSFWMMSQWITRLRRL